MVVQLIIDGPEYLADFSEILYPAISIVDIPSNTEFYLKRMPVKPRALVLRGQIGKAMGSLDTELLVNLHDISAKRLDRR